MSHMEEELCYYRRLLFVGTHQNRLPLSPSLTDASTSMSYTSNGQLHQAPRFNTTHGRQTGGLSGGQMATPYLTSYHSTLAANSTTAVPGPLSAEHISSSFGNHRFTSPSVDSCSTPDQTSARSCSPHSIPNSPVITAPVPNHPNFANFGANVDSEFWKIAISGYDDSALATARNRGMAGYPQYMNTESSSWTG